MKAKEAPEKIYLLSTSYKILDGWYDNELPIPKDMKQLEYIRTDAFIEKAVNWLSEHANDYIVNDRYSILNGEISRDWLKIKSDMFSDFKNYMKGE